MFKKLLCKHTNTESKWKYNDFTYNEFFKCVATVRDRIVVCKDCGKELFTKYVQWISIEQIDEEVKQEYENNKKENK